MKVCFFFFLTLIACSKNVIKKENTPDVKKIDPWLVLENALKENWGKSKLEDKFGKPQEKILFSGSKFESYLYFNKYIYRGEEINSQAWTFDFDDKDMIVTIGYSPTSSGKTMFMDELRKRWANLKCFEKSEPVKTVPHVIRIQKYLSCEGGKIKAYYSKYEEVQDIVVVK